MFHASLPDQSGYYWISDEPDSDEWTIAYLDCDSEPARLLMMLPKLILSGVQRRPTVWERVDNYSGPVVWIGPLSSPGGPCGGACAYFDVDTYRDARKKRQAAVMRHVEAFDPHRTAATITQITPRAVAQAMMKAEPLHE